MGIIVLTFKTVGYLVVLDYACLPALSDVIAHFKAVVKFRTKQRPFQGAKVIHSKYPNIKECYIKECIIKECRECKAKMSEP